MALQIGAAAPHFKLPSVIGEKQEAFQLSDYRGRKNIVILFYWQSSLNGSSLSPGLGKWTSRNYF